jgi:serine/threonine protein kinase
MLAPNVMLQNRYLVVRPIGSGGMGTVYEATDTRLHARVALKETLLTDRASRRAFEREAHLLARLRHPALPKVIDHFSEETGQFLVMEFIAGDDLATLMEKRGGRFPPAAVLPWVTRWADQLLDALDYLHGQTPPVYHRDIKPQNLKLTQRGDIILLDFGLAKGGMAEVSTVTARGEKLLGFTPNYAPLEQIRGSDPDVRSDLYSLGATLYHLLTGTKPPDALTRVAALLNDQPDPLRPANEQNPHVMPAIAAVFHQALAANIEDRLASAVEMRRALHEAQQSRSAKAPSMAATDSHLDINILSNYAPASPEEIHIPHTLTRDPDTDSLSQLTRSFTVNASEGNFPPPAPGTLLYAFKAGSPILSLATSPNGQLLAVGCEDHTIGLWSLHESSEENEATPLRVLNGHEGRISALVFSPDGETLISGSEDRTVCIWHVSDGSLIYRSNTYSDPIESVAISPDGQILAIGGWCGQVYLCRIQQDDLVDIAEFATGFVHSLAFSPDGQLLAAGCYDSTIPLWQVSDQQLVNVLTGHTNFVLTVAFSPNGKFLASSGGETRILLWRINDGRKVDTLRGHTNFIRSLAFNPNGKTIASASEDKSARLWHIGDGSLLHELEGHAEGVTCVAFSPDGQLLISGSRDTKIRVWQAS